MNKLEAKFILEYLVEKEIELYKDLLKTARSDMKEYFKKELIKHTKLLEQITNETLFKQP